ncbi:hypothetical protein A2U01_0084812, partial [Trifolium medium]|nr:hypothetical protein [Trifolium medium]
CLHLVEAVRGGGGKRHRNKMGKGVELKQNSNNGSGNGEVRCPARMEEEDTVVPETVEVINLEVALPRIEPTPTSGLNLLLEADIEG